MRRSSLSGLASALVATALFAACDEDVLDDPTFHMWCGADLCAWKLEAGSVRRAPTWHEADYGVELVDAPTVISQTTDKAPRCIEFTMMADVAPEAQLTVGMDFDDDGTIDVEQPIGASNWHSARTVVTAPTTYSRIKFVITKKGPGRAVIAELRAVSKDDCAPTPPVALTALALGEPCDANGIGNECASAVCCGGVCSECCGAAGAAPSAACEGGSCARIDSAPWQCDPGGHDRAAGAACVRGEDCASGACDGAYTNGVLVDGGSVGCDRVPVGVDAGCAVTAWHGGHCR